MTSGPQIASSEPNFTKPRRVYAQPLMLALLSAAIPGSGQLIQRRFVRAALYFTAFAAVLGVIVAARSFKTFGGFAISGLVMFGVAAVAAWDALFAPVSEGTRKPPGWLFGVLLLVVFWCADHECHLLLGAIGLQSYSIPGSSMQPTVMKGDGIVVDLRAYVHQEPERGDVVILQRLGTPAVRRILGVPGDEISEDDGVVSINGRMISEPYVQFSDENAYGRHFPLVKVPPAKYFALGDSRDISIDSRDEHFGMIDRDQIKARALYVYESNNPRRAGLPVSSVPPVSMASPH